MTKIRIRSEMLARRQQLPAADCLAWSLCIQNALTAQAEFLAAASVALYSPLRNEVFTEQLFAVARQRKQKVAYPRVCGATMEFVEVNDLQQLVPGAFGIREPEGGGIVPAAFLDLVVLPGVAFDLSGYRLGYGKGFYDRVFHAPTRACLVGLAYERQIVESLPTEAHDVRMDVVITEERLFRFDRRSPQVFQHYFHGGSGR